MAYHFLWVKQWRFLTGKKNLPTYYLTDREHREFLNYPMLYEIKHYRYIFRNRREIPWDGTYNQPIFPYMKNNNRTAFVSNGLLEAVEPKASGNF